MVIYIDLILQILCNFFLIRAIYNSLCFSTETTVRFIVWNMYIMGVTVDS